MPKRLLLVRHAKSDWGDRFLKDFDRPLNTRGRKDAPEMGQRLYRNQIIPELLVSSPALRARCTAELFARALHMEEQGIKYDRGIYEASVPRLLNIINHFDRFYDFIALFGHNNGLTDLALYLSRADIYNIPTCGIALIEFPFESWMMVSENTGDLLLFDFPKNPDLDI